LQLVVVGVKVKVQLGLVVEIVDLDLLFAFLRFFEREVRVFQAVYCGGQTLFVKREQGRVFLVDEVGVHAFDEGLLRVTNEIFFVFEIHSVGVGLGFGVWNYYLRGGKRCGEFS
jgi:hypothetical protein